MQGKMGGFITLVLVLLKTGGDSEADFGVSSGTITFELQCADWLSLTSSGIDGVGGFSVGFKISSMDNLHQSTPNRICWSTSQDRYPFSGSHPSLRLQLVHLVLFLFWIECGRVDWVCNFAICLLGLNMQLTLS